MCWGSKFQGMGDAKEKSWRQLCRQQTGGEGLVRIEEYVRRGMGRLGQKCMGGTWCGQPCMRFYMFFKLNSLGNEYPVKGLTESIGRGGIRNAGEVSNGYFFYLITNKSNKSMLVGIFIEPKNSYGSKIPQRPSSSTTT